MRRHLIFGFMVVVIFAAWRPLQARWRRISLEEMVAQSPVVVVGKIERITYADPNEQRSRKYDTAHITVRSVIKNQLRDELIRPGDDVPLTMPSIHNKSRRSVDRRYEKGAEGVWILHYSSGKFWAGHPMSLQPLEKESEIAAIVASSGADSAEVVAGNNEFAFELYGKLRDGQQGENLFFSPYSISTALAMTYAGAGGETATQMSETLHFELGQDSLHRAFGVLEKRLNAGGKRRTYQLTVANALWGQKGYGFREEFLTLVKDSYGAGLNEVDFANDAEKAGRLINKWVADKTREKVKDLIGPGVLDSLTRLVLTNAIYFKGDWAKKFDKEYTTPQTFQVGKEKSVRVPMMHQEGRFRHAISGEIQILELPYEGEYLSMVLFLPEEIDELVELEESLTAENVNRWLSDLHERQVDVYLPRFEITWGVFDLTAVLCEMGMKDAFALPPADFSGMTGRKDLFISNVLHKAFVEVNEEGTEVAAATAVPMTLGAAMPVPVFRADHPFVFIIKDNRTGSILFIGRVMNPQPEDETKKEAKLPQDKNGNFILYVGNQSFAVSPVDIKVWIDDKVAVAQEFDVGNQHNWRAFQYSLPKGTHRLRVESLKGEAKLEEKFEVGGKHWAVLNYWYYPDTHYEPAPKHFSFNVSDEPVYFD